MTDRIIRIALSLVVIGLAYYLYELVASDIRFQQMKERVETARVNRLFKIRDVQFAYRDKHKKFADNWDSLLTFAKKGDILSIKTIGDPDDTTQQVVRDTAYVPVRDSLFSNPRMIDSLPFIPLSANKMQFKIDAGQVDLRGVTVQVFEVKDTDPVDPDDSPLILGSMSEAVFNANREYKGNFIK